MGSPGRTPEGQRSKNPVKKSSVRNRQTRPATRPATVMRRPAGLSRSRPRPRFPAPRTTATRPSRSAGGLNTPRISLRCRSRAWPRRARCPACEWPARPRSVVWPSGPPPTLRSPPATARLLPMATCVDPHTAPMKPARGRTTSPRGPGLPQVVADYEPSNALLAAGRPGHERASGPQYPGVRCRPVSARHRHGAAATAARASSRSRTRPFSPPFWWRSPPGPLSEPRRQRRRP
jgi:hypothetical protein